MVDIALQLCPNRDYGWEYKPIFYIYPVRNNVPQFCCGVVLQNKFRRGLQESYTIK